MDKTPTFKAKSRYFKNTNQAANEDLNNSISKSFESESPGYLSCTQEGFENIDVTWDWNSPQSKKIPKRSQKRLMLNVPKSPKKTLKRHISSNSFEKIQEELRLLKEEIAVPEHEESLVLSPIEEADYKNGNSSINTIDLENFINETEDFFNDSFDEQLLVCTTQIESQLNEVTATSSHCDNKKNDLNFKSVDKKLKQGPIITLPPSNAKMKNQDKFNIIENIIHFEENYQNNKNSNFKAEYNNLDSTVPTFGKVEFHRTQSFEISTENLGGIPLTKKEEIEKKRQEALAKLESKKKQGSFTESPGQCSSEEIERKRLEAIAKREARRQQEIIERNRQNALKRLEMTRKKNASNVKSSLTSRLS